MSTITVDSADRVSRSAGGRARRGAGGLDVPLTSTVSDLRAVRGTMTTADIAVATPLRPSMNFVVIGACDMTVSTILDCTANRPDTDAGTDDTDRDTARDTACDTDGTAATRRPPVNGTARAVPERGPADPGRAGADGADGAGDEVWPSSP